MSVLAREIVAGLVYCVGYIVTATIAYCHNEIICYGYFLVVLAALLHLSAVIARQASEKK